MNFVKIMETLGIYEVIVIKIHISDKIYLQTKNSFIVL
jgi:hypothetical protein